MKKSLIFVGFFGLILLIGLASSTVVTLDRTYDLGDTYSSHNNPTNNYGDEHYLHIWEAGGSYTNLGYIKFNISSIPAGSTINSATLYLYFYSGDLHTTGLNFYAYNTSWDEMTLNWNNQPAGGNLMTTSSPWFSSYNHYYTFSITPSNFSQALNYGLFGQPAGEMGYRLNYDNSGNEIYLRTKETDGSYPPYMIVNYSSPVDTCTYSGSGNWLINCADNCSLNTNVVGDGSNISIIGNGHTYILGNITNFHNKFISGGAGYCTVTCLNGGCLK